MLSKDEVRHIAKLSRLKLSEEEVEKFSKELTSILDYIDILNELDTENVEPTAQVTDLTNVFREDKVLKPESSKEELLDCSPLEVANDQIETFSAHG